MLKAHMDFKIARRLRTEVSTCKFHWSQAIIKNAKKHHLWTRFLTDLKFRQTILMFCALDFIPPDDVAYAFEVLREWACEQWTYDSNLIAFIRYVKDTYIGHSGKKPCFQFLCGIITNSKLPHNQNLIFQGSFSDNFSSVIEIEHLSLFMTEKNC